MPERTDTVEYTADDLAEARRQIAEMLNHKCTPTWWPHRIGEQWACPECRRPWVVDTVDHINGSSEAIAAGHLDPTSLGWRTA